MRNLAMQEKLKRGEALDVSAIGKKHPNFPGVWVLEDYIDNVDYCNGDDERWIFSIGRDRRTGTIYAAEDNRFYENPAFECLWLR